MFSEPQLTYHSLYNYVHSIPVEAEQRNFFNLYSSNPEPPMPSILSKSGAKRSQQKSLKKGISRISQSKKSLPGSEKQVKQVQSNKHPQKGRILKFNIQEAIQSKLQNIKLKEEVGEWSSKKVQFRKAIENAQKSLGNSQSNFGIDQYRIITYVPESTINLEKIEQNVKENSMKNSFSHNKENFFNKNKIDEPKNPKNQLYSIQIVNPAEEIAQELNSWRTSGKIDPFYFNNLNTQFHSAIQQSSIHNQKQKLPASSKNEFTITQNQDLGEISNANLQKDELKNKIKHLEHEIVQISRQKASLLKTNQSLRNQCFSLSEKNHYKATQVSQMIETIQELKQKLEQKNIESPVILSKSHIYEQKCKSEKQQLFIEQQLIKTLQSLELANAKAFKQLSQKSLLITELSGKAKDSSQKVSNLEKQIKKHRQKIENQEEKLYRKDEKINELSLEIDRLNLILKEKSLLKQQCQSRQIEKLRQEEKQWHQVQKDQLKKKHLQMEAHLTHELENVRLKYEQITRDYHHLQKKHLFMKDELDHYKYLQVNGSSALINNPSPTIQNSESNQNSTYKHDKEELKHKICSLESKLQISAQGLMSVEQQYSNLKLNFRALEELYIKQQDELHRIEQQFKKVTLDNNKLKIQLMNLQNTSKAKDETIEKSQNLKLFEKEQQIAKLQRQCSILETKYLNSANQMDSLFQDNQHLLKQNDELTKRHLQQLEIKEEEKARLKRQFTSLEAKHVNCAKELKNFFQDNQILLKQADELNKKYLQQLKKNAQASQHHKQDLDCCAVQIEKREQQKTAIIINEYENLIAKLNDEINDKNNHIFIIEQKYHKELQSNKDYFNNKIQSLLLAIQIKQNEHRKKLQKFTDEKNLLLLENKRKREQSIQRSNYLINLNDHQISQDFAPPKKQHSDSSGSKINIHINLQTMEKKQLLKYTATLEQSYNTLEAKYSKLQIQKQSLQDSFQQNSRLLAHLEQEINHHKQQKEASKREKLELFQELEKSNASMLDFKKLTAICQDEKLLLSSKNEELTCKYNSIIKEAETFAIQIQEFKKIIYEKQAALENYENDISTLRITVLEHQETISKKQLEINSCKNEVENQKSKAEYYKMQFEETQKALEHQLKIKSGQAIQKEFLLCSKQKVEHFKQNMSPLKRRGNEGTFHRSLTKHTNELNLQQVKRRETQLYRREIFRDLNKILNMTNSVFSFDQIIEKNEQQYLKRLFNAIKEDHNKISELKQFVVCLKDKHQKQKAIIKSDYDILYEKYLKYKAMCQDMNREIEKFKLKLVNKDQQFAHINF